MMIKVRIEIETDGKALPGFPITRRIEVAEMQSFDYSKADDGNDTTFTTLPLDVMAAIQALVLTADRSTTLRLDGQSDAGIQLNAGGLIIILDATINAGVTNALINNNSGSAANVKGAAGGT